MFGYQYSEILRSLMCVYLCGGSCIEDVTTHLMKHLSLHPTLRTCSADTILRAIEELTFKSITYKSASGKSYDFNTADKMNCLLVNALLATGQLKSGQEYDFDFDHQFIETEKYDAKPTYKKFLGYSPGVAVINDMIVGIENRDGNTNVRFNQKETLERIFKRLEASEIYISRARMDCGSCSEEIVDMVEAHCRHFYIRANRCSSFYDSMFALTGWKTVEINGIVFELNSILVEKWKGKPYRLVIQRQRRMGSGPDLWEGEYTYRCILTNDYESSMRDIVEFYNMRGGKERVFDDMNNGFGWDRLPKSFMAENTVFLLLTALLFAFIIGTSVGIIAALKQNTIFDYIVMVITLVGVSMPIFWLALMLVLQFSVKMNLLPVMGMGDLSKGFGDVVSHMILPGFCLATIPMATFARTMRSSMIDIMSSDYIRCLRARGIKKLKVILIHGLKNALPPLITVLGLQIAGTFTGAIITEGIFSWPGMGTMINTAINNRDYSLIQGAVLFSAIMFVFCNMLVDIAYAILNPKVKLEKG